jgi:hypothetical protein
LRIYTRGYLNLKNYLNQRSESIYSITIKIFNKNINIKKAARRLENIIKVKFRELNKFEVYIEKKLSRTFNLKVFR